MINEKIEHITQPLGDNHKHLRKNNAVSQGAAATKKPKADRSFKRGPLTTLQNNLCSTLDSIDINRNFTPS